jgi:hypothetical protein
LRRERGQHDPALVAGAFHAADVGVEVIEEPGVGKTGFWSASFQIVTMAS